MVQRHRSISSFGKAGRAAYTIQEAHRGVRESLSPELDWVTLEGEFPCGGQMCSLLVASLVSSLDFGNHSGADETNAHEAGVKDDMGKTITWNFLISHNRRRLILQERSSRLETTLSVVWGPSMGDHTVM